MTVLVAVLGAWAGTRLRLPAGALLGPLILGVALAELGVVQLAWPPGVPQAAYLVLGLWVGLLFDGASVKRPDGCFRPCSPPQWGSYSRAPSWDGRSPRSPESTG